MTDRKPGRRSSADTAPRVPRPGEAWKWPTHDDPTSYPINLHAPGPHADPDDPRADPPDPADLPDPPDLPDPDAGLPRDENGRVPAYYRCTADEIEAFGLTPPPLRHRHDDWTPEMMARFVEALGATGTVSGACAIVGKSRMSAYRLRNRADAGAFRAAWDEALRCVTAILADTAYERALEGTVEDVWHKGEKVGERRRFNDRLLMFLLRVRDPHGYAPIDQLDRALRRKALPADGALARARDAVGPAEEAWGLRLEPGGEAPAVARLSAPPPCTTPPPRTTPPAPPLPPSVETPPGPAALPPASDEAPDAAPPPDGEMPSHV